MTRINPAIPFARIEPVCDLNMPLQAPGLLPGIISF
jgi:hypothetical protein